MPKASMSYDAGSSTAAAARTSEVCLTDASLVDIPSDNAPAAQFQEDGYFVPRRHPLPIPYVPSRFFQDPEPLSKIFWCPSLVNRIDNEYSTASANFFYSLPRKRPSLRDHMGCTIKRCTANNTDAKHYLYSHWKDCPKNEDCAFVGPSAQDVMNIIADGGIPLISIGHSVMHGLTFKVVRATFKSKFFAVSHVWSGGLGNPEANRLLTCQTMRLYNIGHELDDMGSKKGGIARWTYRFRKLKKLRTQMSEHLLWIDTLCIPVNNRELRGMAINSMARIYAAAQSIVILDDELQDLSFKTTRRSEIFGHLFCSAWASRCWTFQEGAMAKEWIVQFDDGLCSIDFLFQADSESLGERLGNNLPYPPTESWETTVLSDVAEWFRKMPRLRGMAGQYTFSQKSSILAFLEIWNNLCLRTTTMKDDLICIVAIMLDLRPSEVLDIRPPEHRLLAIFNTREKLPLGLLFREREEISHWDQTRRWLPTNIEERSADATESFLRRRSDDENFFVFDCSIAQRFYFTKIEKGNPRSLYLIKPPSKEALMLRLLLSPGLDLPEMDICIMMSDSPTWIPYEKPEPVGHSEFNERHEIEEVTEKFGVCLGIRKATDDYVQFFYICPVKCLSDYSGAVRGDMILVSTQEKPPLKVGMECVIEHDFSSASKLSQSRASFTITDRLRLGVALLLIPYFTILIFWLSCYFFAFLQMNYNYFFLPLLFLLCIRYLPFIFELYTIVEATRQVEFDTWFTNLYRDKVYIPYTEFYIHCRPKITVGALILSGVLLPVTLLVHKGEDIWFLLSRVVEIEFGVLLLRWCLELYAHAPGKINLLLRFASFATNKQQIMPYYDMFYAPSRFTVFLRRLAPKLRGYLEQHKVIRSGWVDERFLEDGNDSSPSLIGETEGPSERPRHSRELAASSPDKGKQVVHEPWLIDPVGTFTTNIRQRVLDLQGSGRSAGHLDPLAPLHCLHFFLYGPYLTLIFFWGFWGMIFSGALFFTAGHIRNPFFYLTIFATIQLILTSLEWSFFTLRIRRLLVRDQSSRPTLSHMRISLHYPTIITAPILITTPIFVLLGIIHKDEEGTLNIFITIGLGLLVQSMPLGLRFLIESSARGSGVRLPNFGQGFGDIDERGFGNGDLDACYVMLYRASRLTRWLEAAEKYLFPRAVKNSYWERVKAQSSIRLDLLGNGIQDGEEFGGGHSSGAAGEEVPEDSDESVERRSFWARLLRAWERGAIAGKHAAGPLAKGALNLFKPVYVVAAKTLVVIDSVAKTSVRQGGMRQDEYTDDGENLLSEDFSN